MGEFEAGRADGVVEVDPQGARVGGAENGGVEVAPWRSMVI